MRINVKTLGAIAVGSALTVALVGCSSGNSSAGGAKKISIGMFGTGTSNAYQIANAKGAEAAAKKLGVKLTQVQSNFDVQSQNNQMQLAVQRKTYDGWLLGVEDGEQQCNQFRQDAAKVPIVLNVLAVCNGDNKGAVSFVGEQTPALYTTWWNYILSQNTPQPIAVLTGPPLLDITKYTNSTLQAALAKHPGFKVVSNQTTDYTTGNAYKVTQDLLHAHPDVRIIASNYAGVTQGVVQAVKAAGLEGKVKVYDLLGDKNIVNLIKQGEVTATIPGVPYSEGYQSVVQLVNYLKGKKVSTDVNPLDSLNFPGKPFVTKENVGEFTAQY